jgi:hypothetical protein
MHIMGKVASVSVRRPLVSMRKTVGIVLTNWSAPYPSDAYRAWSAV